MGPAWPSATSEGTLATDADPQAGSDIDASSTGRRVLITGTSYGLGASISSYVRKRGDDVYSMSRTAPDHDADERWVQADMGDPAQIREAVARFEELLEGATFDGVVLNAALADKSRSQWTVDQVERHLRINALGPFALWTELEERGLIGDPCNVVLMGSFLQNGNVRQPAYAMSKAAMWSWMRSYTMGQDAVAPVSMNMIWPGRVLTPANPMRVLPADDPNLFFTPDRVTETVVTYLYQSPNGPRGTVVDLGRS
jgi:NAD(P)-dependent dehydrogenase (short-subunit alcohol dehydrogenase family)